MENSTTRQTLLALLRELGYVTLELLLTPLQFGIPNSRLRYYLLAKKSPLQFAHLPSQTADEGRIDRVWRRIPGGGPPWTDPRFADIGLVKDTDTDVTESGDTEAVNTLQRYLDNPYEIDDAHYAKFRIPDRVLHRWGRLFDIVKPSSRRTCCFTRGKFEIYPLSSPFPPREETDCSVLF